MKGQIWQMLLQSASEVRNCISFQTRFPREKDEASVCPLGDVHFVSQLVFKVIEILPKHCRLAWVPGIWNRLTSTLSHAEKVRLLPEEASKSIT